MDDIILLTIILIGSVITNILIVDFIIQIRRKK